MTRKAERFAGRWTVALLGVAASLLIAGSARAAELTLVESRKVWDAAPHNAFTDLVRFKDEWICVFREGKGHVSPDGALRVIVSKDGKQWTSAALITSDKADLRDAKITLAPGGRLMLSGAGAMHRKPPNHQSSVWFSEDGRHWSEAMNVGDPDLWLWRVTWRGDLALGIGYGTADKHFIRLYQSKDGKKFETIVEDMGVAGYPNETSIVFLKDQTALCLLRRYRSGQASATGMLGSARPPYREWTWKDLGVQIGGPHMLELPDGRFIAAVRLYDKAARTSLCWLDAKAGTLTEALKLPSGGDTSYAGLVWHDDHLWVSYYSSHEGKTSIYFAKVRVGKP